jgi:antitoxin PrlF
MPTATITSKGQVTIPLEVRERLRLEAGDKIDFHFGPQGEITLTSNRIPFEKIQGMLRSPGQKVAGVREMDKGIERAVRDRWKRAARRVK